jgi:hypothetical protein
MITYTTSIQNHENILSYTKDVLLMYSAGGRVVLLLSI